MIVFVMGGGNVFPFCMGSCYMFDCVKNEVAAEMLRLCAVQVRLNSNEIKSNEKKSIRTRVEWKKRVERQKKQFEQLSQMRSIRICK